MSIAVPYMPANNLVEQRNYDKEYIEYMEQCTGRKNLIEKLATVLESSPGKPFEVYTEAPKHTKPRHAIDEYTPTPEPYRTPMSDLIKKHLTAIPELI